MSIKLGSVPCIVGSSAKIAREILQTNDLTFASRPKVAAGKYTTYNYSDIAWSPYGEHWRLARKICLTELFSAKRLESYEYIRVEEVARMVASVVRSSAAALPVHLRKDTTSMSNNIISRMVSGQRYLDENGGNKIKPHEFKEMLEELFVLNGVFNIGDYIPALSFLDLPDEEAQPTFGCLSRGVAGGAWTNGGRECLSMCPPIWWTSCCNKVMILPTTLPGTESRPSQDMIAAGTESPGTLVEWALAKANEEMDIIVDKERWVQEKDIGEMEYLHGIVKENLRLHPVAPMLIPHLSTQQCKIGGDETEWENPEEFRPERFHGSSLDVKRRDYELLPFGSGRRMCPGANLALKVVQLGLANLVHGFEWSLLANQRPQDLDMTETYGLSTPKTEPLVAMADPRLPSHLYRFP